MIVTPDYCSFYKLFDASNCFVIPKYQRGYAWTEDEVSDFCDDVKKMVKEGKEHFFGAIVCSENTTNPKVKRIKVAVEMIDELIQNLITKKKLTAVVKELEQIEDAVTTRGYLIHVVASSVTDAYKLFQVLNNRGLSLSAGDLLRALTLEQLHSGSGSLSEKAEEIWDNLLDDKSSKVEERLRWYYAAHNGSYPGKSTLYEDFKCKFNFDGADTDSKRKKLIERLEDMSNAFSFFTKIEDGQWPLNKPTPLPKWYEYRLNNLVKVLRHTHCLPLLYAVSLKGTQQNLLSIIRVLERFFFRYKIMCRGHATPMSDIYLSHAHSAISQEKKVDANDFKKDLNLLIDKYASEEVFLTALRKLEYLPRGGNKDIKYFLISAEEDWVWFKSGKTISRREGMENKSRIFDFNTTTIEHIYSRNSSPQNRDVGMEDVKNNMGNLTILDPDANSRLGNKSWVQKKAVLKSSNIGMNMTLARKASWKKSQFDQHEKMLCDAACKIFSI